MEAFEDLDVGNSYGNRIFPEMKVEYKHYTIGKTPLSEAGRQKPFYCLSKEDFILTFRTHLHRVKLGVLCDQPGEVLDAVQGGGGAASL